MKHTSLYPPNFPTSFVKGVRGTDPILSDGIPHVAFVGRSNVGKSSVINSLLGTRIAISSTTPGRTQEMNFFLVANKMYFVDLPGYGFARMPAKVAERMRKMLVWYLAESGVRPKLIFLIVDAKVGITDLDQAMIGLMKDARMPFMVIINKKDKLTQKERAQILKKITAQIAPAKAVLYSAKTGEGREEALAELLG